MHRWRQFFAKLSTMFHRGRAEKEIARDVESQLGMIEDQLQRRGVPAGNARLAARRAYGGVEQAKELARDELTFVWLEHLLQDVRHAFRSLSKSRAFVAVTLVSLGLGIGANTAIFTLVNGVLLKRLPVPDPDRIVQLQARLPQFESPGFSFPVFRELRRQTGIFADAIAFSGRPALAGMDGDSHPIDFELVTGSFFPFFGARPALGRLLDEEDDRVEGAHPVCVLSYQAWQTRFGGDPRVVGRTIRVEGVPLQVVGVAERKFVGPELQRRFDLWAPTALAGSFGVPRESANWIWLHALARLKPGLSLPQAGARLAAASRGIEDALPKERANRGAVYQVRDASNGFDSWRSQLQDPLLVLMGAVILVLLVACANLANILVARAGARRQEFAIKLWLGISRGRLLRQLLLETFLLVSAGGTLGVLVSAALTNFLLDQFNSGNRFASLHVTPDARVLAFTFGVSILTALIAGLYPAWQASHTDGGAGLKAISLGRRRAGAVRRGLILVQVTAAVVLLFAASLFTHSLGKLKTIDLGYDIDRVLQVSIDASGPQKTIEPAKAPPALAEVLARVRQLPYVESAAFSVPGVLSGAMMAGSLSATDTSGNVRNVDDVYFLFAGPRYFATMRLPLLRGRDFTQTDRSGSQPVLIVNQRLASLLWPGEVPIGKHIAGFDIKDLEVIGVVGNSKYQNVRETTKAIAYRCFDQTPLSSAALQLRYRGRASQVERDVRQIVKSAAPAYQVSNASTMELLRDSLIALERLLTFLSALFGALGLALALTGIYGLISYSVTQRTREIGIRVSVGARQIDVLRLFLRESLMLTAAGILLGIPIALQLTRLTRRMLFEVSTADPAGISVTLILILLGGALASIVPARRALRVNPVEALRCD